MERNSSIEIPVRLSNPLQESVGRQIKAELLKNKNVERVEIQYGIDTMRIKVYSDVSALESILVEIHELITKFNPLGKEKSDGQ